MDEFEFGADPYEFGGYEEYEPSPYNGDDVSDQDFWDDGNDVSEYDDEVEYDDPFSYNDDY